MEGAGTRYFTVCIPFGGLCNVLVAQGNARDLIKSCDKAKTKMKRQHDISKHSCKIYLEDKLYTNNRNLAAVFSDDIVMSPFFFCLGFPLLSPAL